MITSYEDKAKKLKGILAVLLFYFYRVSNVNCLHDNDCGYNESVRFAAWLNKQILMPINLMLGNRCEVYKYMKSIFSK